MKKTKITAIVSVLLCIMCMFYACAPKQVESAKLLMNGKEFISENIPKLTDVN